jgi:uncharacterized HAD superfamily protein
MNGRKILLVDLDDTTQPFIDSLIDFALYEKGISLDKKKFTTADLTTVLGLTESQKYDFMTEYYASMYFTEMSFFPNSVDKLKELKKQGIEQVVLTGRPSELTDKATYNSLHSAFGKNHFLDVRFTQKRIDEGKHGDKLDIALEYSPVAMAEDRLDIAEKFNKAGIKCFVKDNIHNQGELPPNSLRFYNWKHFPVEALLNGNGKYK